MQDVDQEQENRDTHVYMCQAQATWGPQGIVPAHTLWFSEIVQYETATQMNGLCSKHAHKEPVAFKKISNLMTQF